MTTTSPSKRCAVAGCDVTTSEAQGDPWFCETHRREECAPFHFDHLPRLASVLITACRDGGFNMFETIVALHQAQLVMMRIGRELQESAEKSDAFEATAVALMSRAAEDVSDAIVAGDLCIVRFTQEGGKA